VRFRHECRAEHPDWWNAPVPAFGDPDAWLAIVGLAPGKQGANRTGRPFTGDYAGELLYGTLLKFGLAKGEYRASPGDGLQLNGATILNAVKCLPPGNKPLPEEVRRCNRHLAEEIAQLRPRALLALGAIAHGAILRALSLRPSGFRFAHHAVHDLPCGPFVPDGTRLFDSYHCSRYNTQTKRLTAAMFEAVVRGIATFLRGVR